MHPADAPFVIAIAAVSGGGKTTVTKHLQDQLHSSCALHFDDYEFEGPNDIVDWIDRGGNPDEWKLDPLVKDLKVLSNQSASYILIDFPFSYHHAQVRKFINFSVFVDTPLDVALSRRMIRDKNTSSADQIMIDLESYITRERPAYLHMLQTIKPDADLVVDGTLPASEISQAIAAALMKLPKE